MASSVSTEEQYVTEVTDNYETTCWGCGLHVLLPSCASIFKCGWCGAITDQTKQKRDQKCFGWRQLRDRCFVSVVIIFMLFVICGGVWAVFPVVFSVSLLCGIFHLTLTAILSVAAISSFGLAAFRCAGTPPNILWGSYPTVGKGDLENYTFCHYCSKPKSPRAHHCRSCRKCILDMDHHCPFRDWHALLHGSNYCHLVISVLKFLCAITAVFVESFLDYRCFIVIDYQLCQSVDAFDDRIGLQTSFVLMIGLVIDFVILWQIGNCVGAANHCSFVIFLMSAVMSTMYVSIMSVYAGLHMWPPLKLSLGSLNGISSNKMAWRLMKEFIVALMRSAFLLSSRGLVLAYLFIASVSLQIGLSVLLWQQLSYIYQGKTYLSHLSSQGDNEEEKKDCQNLVRFFGFQYSVTRFLPNFGVIPKRHVK